MVTPDIRDGKYLLYAADGSVFAPPVGCDFANYLKKGFRMAPLANTETPTPKPEKRKRDID